jgi:CheY-like chemotaxis protein/HPt (histidine-containing phosphotransfer) domain-containing protein
MPPPSSPLRTLVIDDDEMSRELLIVLLEAEGYAVDSAQSGEEALAQLSESHHVYDVILTDLQMPGVAGTELAKQLRRACGPRPLLLAISGSQPPAADLAPYDGFLLKPFRVEAIATALLNRVSRIESHQSTTSPTPPNLPSIAASTTQEASNQGMNIPIQGQEFKGRQSQSAESTVNNGIASIPVLNEQIYRQLAGSMPSPQLQEMYTLCVNDARKRIAAMRKLIAERDAAQFVREAHAIKGGSGMLGATELHRLAATLETCGLSSGQQGSAQDVNSLDELCAACDRLERMLISRV